MIEHTEQQPSSSGIQQSRNFLPPPIHPSLRRVPSSALSSGQNASIPQSQEPLSTPSGTKVPVHPSRNLATVTSPLQVSHSMPGSVTDLNDFDPLNTDTVHDGLVPEFVSDNDSILEEELSETQLRELYDDEEIDRFLTLFAAVRSTCYIVQRELNLYVSNFSK